MNLMCVAVISILFFVYRFSISVRLNLYKCMQSFYLYYTFILVYDMHFELLNKPESNYTKKSRQGLEIITEQLL